MSRAKIPTWPEPTAFPLPEFATERFAYRDGEHVTIIGPTGWGKTFLAYELLAATAKPKRPAVIFVIKPRDETATAWARAQRIRRLRSWPPPLRLFRAPERAWLLWPEHSFDPDRDDANLYRTFRGAMLDGYKRGNRILFADEPLGLMELEPPERRDPNLERYLRMLWQRGRSMKAGLWTATQRPVEIPLAAYSQAHHLFLGRDDDKRARDRYAEIGGVDPDMVKYVTARLPKHHWLYIRREDQKYAIVTPNA